MSEVEIKTPASLVPPFHVQYGATYSVQDDCWFAVTELVIGDRPPEDEVVWTQFTFTSKELALGFAQTLAQMMAGSIRKDLLKWAEKQVAKLG